MVGAGRGRRPETSSLSSLALLTRYADGFAEQKAFGFVELHVQSIGVEDANHGSGTEDQNCATVRWTSDGISGHASGVCVFTCTETQQQTLRHPSS